MSGKDVVITEAMLDAGLDARIAFRTKPIGELVLAIYTAMRRAELDATSAASGATVRVRIAVAVDCNGKWYASGVSRWNDQRVLDEMPILGLAEGETYHWIEADVPVPQRVAATVIEGVVS